MQNTLKRCVALRCGYFFILLKTSTVTVQSSTIGYYRDAFNKFMPTKLNDTYIYNRPGFKGIVVLEYLRTWLIKRKFKKIKGIPALVTDILTA